MNYDDYTSVGALYDAALSDSRKRYWGTMLFVLLAGASAIICLLI